jgi:hypothetical protein
LSWYRRLAESDQSCVKVENVRIKGKKRLKVCYSEDGKESKNERGGLARFAKEASMVLGLAGPDWRWWRR